MKYIFSYLLTFRYVLDTEVRTFFAATKLFQNYAAKFCA